MPPSDPDQSKATKKTEFNFNGPVKNVAPNGKIVDTGGGDNFEEVAGNVDQSQGKISVAGDATGPIVNSSTNARGAAEIQTPAEAIANLFQVMESAAEPILTDGFSPSSDPAPVDDSKVPLSDFADDLADHPATLGKTAEAYAAMPPEELAAIPEDEQNGFLGSLKSCWDTCAPVAGRALTDAAGLAIPVIEAMSVIPFPYNLILPLAKGLAKQNEPG